MTTTVTTTAAAAYVALDDVDSRPGSVTSLVRTVLGLHLRELGGWIPVAGLVRLLEALDVPADRSRVAVGRLKTRGVLAAATRDGRSGYALTPRAEAMLERGDERIFGATSPRPAGWLLVSFSVPEERRGERHQLRRRLAWAGCGTVSPGLWITPAHRARDVAEAVAAVGLEQHVTTFACAEVTGPRPLADAVGEWWDLDALAAQHRAFLQEHDRRDAAADGRSAFVRLVRLVDAWRPIPYADPGLPLDLLPHGWPGRRSAEVVADAPARHLAAAHAWVRESVRPA